MEQLLSDIRAYARAAGIQPATVVQYATGQNASQWERWCSGGGCTIQTAEKIKKYMAENAPVPSEKAAS